MLNDDTADKKFNIAGKGVKLNDVDELISKYIDPKFLLTAAHLSKAVSSYGGIYIQGHVTNNFMNIYRSTYDTVAPTPLTVRDKIQKFFKDNYLSKVKSYDLFALSAYVKPDAAGLIKSVD